MTDPFLRRLCSITRGSEGPFDLYIDFDRPGIVEGTPFPTFQGNVRLHCRFFDETHSASAGDELGVLVWLMTIAEGSLRSLQRTESYQIYWTAEGDLDFSDFWRYRP